MRIISGIFGIILFKWHYHDERCAFTAQDQRVRFGYCTELFDIGHLRRSGHAEYISRDSATPGVVHNTVENRRLHIAVFPTGRFQTTAALRFPCFQDIEVDGVYGVMAFIIVCFGWSGVFA